MSAGDMSLLSKEIDIQLIKVTRGQICKNSDKFNFMTKFRYKYPNR